MAKHEDEKHMHSEHHNQKHQNHEHHDHHMHEGHNHNHDGHGNHGHDHGSHGGHRHHDHGDMVSEFKKRFFISLIVTIPIISLSPMVYCFMGLCCCFLDDKCILIVVSLFVCLC